MYGCVYRLTTWIHRERQLSRFRGNLHLSKKWYESLIAKLVRSSGSFKQLKTGETDVRRLDWSDQLRLELWYVTLTSIRVHYDSFFASVVWRQYWLLVRRVFIVGNLADEFRRVGNVELLEIKWQRKLLDCGGYFVGEPHRTIQFLWTVNEKKEKDHKSSDGVATKESKSEIYWN